MGKELTAGDSLERDLRNADDIPWPADDHYRLTKQYIHADGHLIWADLSVSSRAGRPWTQAGVLRLADRRHHRRGREQAAIAQRDQQNRAWRNGFSPRPIGCAPNSRSPGIT